MKGKLAILLVGFSLTLFAMNKDVEAKKGNQAQAGDIIALETFKNELIPRQKRQIRLRNVDFLVNEGSIASLKKAEVLLVGLQKDNLMEKLETMIEDKKEEKRKAEEKAKKDAQIKAQKEAEEKARKEAAEQKKKPEKKPPKKPKGKQKRLPDNKQNWKQKKLPVCKLKQRLQQRLVKKQLFKLNQ